MVNQTKKHVVCEQNQSFVNESYLFEVEYGKMDLFKIKRREYKTM